jgi:hypothetical protein
MKLATITKDKIMKKIQASADASAKLVDKVMGSSENFIVVFEGKAD